jgi:beta-glucosidase
VLVRVRNAGRRAGREVIQLYVETPDGDATRPVRTLQGFANVSAEAGESVEARVTLPPRAFARFDDASRSWVFPPGKYTIRAGRSSRDLRLQTEVVLR